MRKFIKKIKNSILGKILKFLFKLIKWSLEILIITTALIVLVQRVTNNEYSFLGFRVFNVASGSMEPEYAVGDMLIAKEKDPSTIKEGDNIVYMGTKSDYQGRIITHAVIQVEQDENGDYLFHTKGHANTMEDPVVHEDQLYGVVVQNNIVLAWIFKILTNKYGLYFFVMVPIILYAFIEFVKIQGKKIEAEREEEAREREQQKEKEKSEQLNNNNVDVNSIENEEKTEQQNEEQTKKTTRRRKVKE